ncbi:MAG: phosphoenolpyruvate--protein phosphotransferase [Gemmatimonadales bacterium]
MTRSLLLTGIGVSPGIAVGPIYVLGTELPELTHRTISEDQVKSEIARLHQAIDTVRQQLTELKARTRTLAGPEEAKIFAAQIAMLEDRDFLDDVERLVAENQLTAERAFEFKVLEVRAIWAQSSSATLRQRVADLLGIQIRVLRSLLGKTSDAVMHDKDAPPAIVLTKQLTAGLTVQLEKDHVIGLASERGTRTAHAAILARSLGIPCVMGLVGAKDDVVPGSMAILDGSLGTILIDPSEDQIRDARVREGRRLEMTRELEAVLGKPSVTSDGTYISLRSNIDLPEEVEIAAEHGAEGVGLLRTEFLVVGRTELPGEDEQARFFEKVGRSFAPHPVVVRSYDLGGDKFPATFNAEREANPFLGWRAIRVCLDEPDLFRTQIRALLRARASSDVRLMLPLVTDLREVERTRDLVEVATDELRAEGVEFGEDLPVGVMIETPAAAAMVDELAELSDFLSVGTNDLTQYTLAVDRGNARLADRFNSLHPAIVRLLKQILDGGRRTGLDVSVCGEMASEPLPLFLLIGLGFRTVSGASASLPLVRWLIRRLDVKVAESAVQEVLRARHAREVTTILERHIAGQVDLDLLEFGRLPTG